MASNPHRVVVEVTPVRVRLAVTRGRELTTRREREVESWDHAWEVLAETIGGWVRELGLKGVRAAVLYASPTARAIVHSSPVESGRENARAEAIAALPRTLGVTQARCIAADWTETAGNGAARVHTLAAGDDAATPARIAAMIAGAGLGACEVIPGTAVLLAAATRQVSSLARSSAPCVIGWIGEHACALAAGDARRIACVRAVELGTRSANPALLMERLSDELATIAREHPGLGASPELTLWGETLDGEELARRAGLRFGEPRPDADAGSSMIGALSSAGPTLVDLAPRESGEQAGRKTRVARTLGVTAALAAVVIHGVGVRDDLSRAEARAARITMDRGAIADHAAIALCRSVADAQRRAHAALGRSIDAPAAMAMLANATPASVRFDRLEIDERGLRARGEVDPSRGGPESMQALLESLRASPMVVSARLGPASGGTGPARFELVLELRTTPRSIDGILASATEDLP